MWELALCVLGQFDAGHLARQGQVGDQRLEFGSCGCDHKFRRLCRGAFDHFKALILKQIGQSLWLKRIVLYDQSGEIQGGSPFFVYQSARLRIVHVRLGRTAPTASGNEKDVRAFSGCGRCPQQAVMARGILAMFGAGPARFGAAVKPNCPYCFCLGWVCENHPHLASGHARVVTAASRDNAIIKSGRIPAVEKPR